MKIFFLFLVLSIANCCLAQSVEENEIEVKLFLPTHVKNELKPTDKLEIYFTKFSDDSATKIPLKVIGRKLRDNVYTFKVPQMRFWHVGFKIGLYGQAMFCVDNLEGEGQANEDFDIHLAKYQRAFTNPEFLPPCVRSDDEE
jgi:hypothetical protein